MAQDLFYQFIEEYEKGQILQALQLIIPYPDIHYDSLNSENSLFRYLVNFVDSTVFKKIWLSYEINSTLRSIFSGEPRLVSLTSSFREILEFENTFQKFYSFNEESLNQIEDIKPYFKQYFLFIQQGKELTEDLMEGLLQEIPPLSRPSIERHLMISKAWMHYKQSKPNLATLVEEEHGIFSLPWFAFAFNLPLEPKILAEGEVPLIFLEPLENVDYLSFLEPYLDKELIFVAETSCAFAQLLQFDDLQRIFSSPQSKIYILELYPNAQFLTQNFSWDHLKSFKPILLTPRVAFEEVMPLFTQVLGQCLTQTPVQLKEDTSIGNWLYHLTKRLLFRIEAERYGRSRWVALRNFNGLNEWHDIHKGLPPANADLGPLPFDLWGNHLQLLLEKRQPRPFAPEIKIRLAHVIPQIIDGNHAPSRILRVLVSHSDPTWFEPFVLISERLMNNLLDYPKTSFESPPSRERGKQTLESFQKQNIAYYIEDQISSFEAKAFRLAEILRQLKIDVVVFHGSDDVNSLCSALTDVPIRLFFDHGALPEYPCYDLLILSTEDTFKQKREFFRQMGMESCPLGFGVDARANWEPEPFPKEKLGLPANSFVMTTISNHLNSRLSSEMCHAIGEILKRSPTAYYAPMGRMDQTTENKLRNIFAQYGVNDRVMFLGSQPQASQCARSMQLYLNEFPFGSGLGILDAMAAGCPVVSMYDPNGPQQARYGGAYFGLDYVIQSGRVEDYIDLACRLISDPVLYQTWSAHAKAQYDKRVNEKEYVKIFESIIEHFIEYKQKSHNNKKDSF